MSVKALLAGLLCLLPLPAVAQGFAGLGQTAEGFALPLADTPFDFPKDHGPHPEFRIEWWYVTANLTGADGKAYGIQWTLFRNALAPGGAAKDQVWMGHAAIATPDGHLFAERLARGGIGQADVLADPFEAYIDEWSMAGPDPNTINLTAQGIDFRYDLRLTADRPFVAQGEGGYSVKSAGGQASHYYSQPFYTVEGLLTLPSGPVEVTGMGWLDREWSSQPLASDQLGWDWVSLHFDSGDKMMGFQLRDRTGGTYTTGTWIAADGTPTPLGNRGLQMRKVKTAQVAGREIPVVWDVALPSRDLAVRVSALYPDSWMGTGIAYWEGPVLVSGSHGGIGYLEMSGY